MKKNNNNSQIRFNLYLSTSQAEQVRHLFAVGLTMSSIARQSIRKCCDMQLQPDSDTPFPDRFNFYLDRSDAETLATVAIRENCQRSEALRRLIDTYLTNNAEAINQLF